MDNSIFTAEEFIKDVNLLFSSNDREEQKKANQYLVIFAQSPKSYSIVLQILATPNLDNIIYFNALNVVKNKIKFSFGNLTENPEIIQNLLKLLIDQIDYLQNSKHFLLLNFCKCFAMGMLFSFNCFNEILRYCVSKLNSNNNQRNLLSLIMIFNYLAEAREDKQIVIDEDKRKIFCNNLKSIECDVLHFLNMMVVKRNEINSIENLNTNKDNLNKLFKYNILEAFTNWVSAGLGEYALKKLSGEYIEIINFVFSIEEDQIEKHSESICNLLQLPFERDEMKKLESIIIGKTMGLLIVYNQKKGQLKNEQISFFIDIVTTLCNRSIDKIIEEQQFNILQIMVELTEKCPSNDIRVICEVWGKFNNYFSNKGIHPQVVLNQFKSLIMQTVLHMITLMKYPNEIFAKLNIKRTREFQHNDEFNTTMDYRVEIKLLFTDFAKEYSFEFMYNDIIFPEIEKTVNKIKEQPTSIEYWSHFEVLLYSFMCICREVLKYNNIDFLDQLFNTIFEIPKDFVQIIRIVTDIFDEMEMVLSKQ